MAFCKVTAFILQSTSVLKCYSFFVLSVSQIVALEERQKERRNYCQADVLLPFFFACAPWHKQVT